MAKIAFFTEQIDGSQSAIAHFSIKLIKSLADSHHDIQVFTSYHEENLVEIEHPKVKVVRAFTKWSISEIPKAMQILYQFKPDVIHTIQPFSTKKVSWLKNISYLPLGLSFGLAATDTQALKVVTFFDFNESFVKSGPQQFIISNSDLITVANSHQKNILTSSPGLTSGIPVEVFPIQFDVPSDATQEYWFNRKPNICFFIPGNLHQQNQIESLIEFVSQLCKINSNVRFLVPEGYGAMPFKKRREFSDRLRNLDISDAFLVLENLNWSQQLDLLNSCDFVFAPTTQLTSFSLTYCLQYCLLKQKIAFLSPAQSLLFSQQTENFIQISQINSHLSLSLVLKSIDDSATPKPEIFPADFAGQDNVANWMSRLYIRNLDLNA